MSASVPGGSDLTLGLGCLDVSLRFEAAEAAARTLARVWSLAMGPPRTHRVARVAYAVRAAPDGYVVRNLDGAADGPVLPDARDVAPFLEAALYADLRHHAPRLGFALLHGALVGDVSEAYLFVGDSGAGKSALARAAVEAGLDYHADEHVLLGDEGFVGLPRAIHLDPRGRDEAPPPWALDADATTYPFVDREGGEAVLPLVPVAHAARDRALGSPWVVALRRGPADLVAPEGRQGALAALSAAVLVGAPEALARLVEPRPCVTLAWQQPRSALDALRALRHAEDARARAPRAR